MRLEDLVLRSARAYVQVVRYVFKEVRVTEGVALITTPLAVMLVS
jgi:hypothetical protein